MSVGTWIKHSTGPRDFLSRGVAGARRLLTYRLYGDDAPISAAGVSARIEQRTDAERWHRAYAFDRERPIIADCISRTYPDDVFWDVGANVGVWSCLVGQVTDHPPVVFEPATKNRRAIFRNLGRAGTGLEHTHVRPVALWHTDGELAFVPDERDEAGAGHGRIAEGGTETVHARTADGLVGDGDLPQPSVMKIDVEGAERAVIRGASKTLDSVRLVYVEIHDVEDLSAVRETLTGHGFGVDVLDESETQAMIRGVAAR